MPSTEGPTRGDGDVMRRRGVAVDRCLLHIKEKFTSGLGLLHSGYILAGGVSDIWGLVEMDVNMYI
jgi:hypothetical protein